MPPGSPPPEPGPTAPIALAVIVRALQRASRAACRSSRPRSRKLEIDVWRARCVTLEGSRARVEFDDESRFRDSPRCGVRLQDYGPWSSFFFRGFGMADVYRVTEVVGVSSESWEAAARVAVETASQSVRELRVAEVVRQDLTIQDGAVVNFRVRLGISFKYDRSQ
jgi:dodecin